MKAIIYSYYVLASAGGLIRAKTLSFNDISSIKIFLRHSNRGKQQWKRRKKRWSMWKIFRVYGIFDLFLSIQVMWLFFFLKNGWVHNLNPQIAAWHLFLWINISCCRLVQFVPRLVLEKYDRILRKVSAVGTLFKPYLIKSITVGMLKLSGTEYIVNHYTILQSICKTYLHTG